MNARPRILVLSHFYLPGYLAGGPIRSIANLVEHLGDDFEWMILTSDRDSGASAPYSGVSQDVWVPVGKANVFYASPAMLRPSRLLAVLRDTPHDLLYLNSFFDPWFGIFPAVAAWLGKLPRKPLLIAPRGEFSLGALGIKAWKKKPYVRLARVAGVYRGASWHASTALEAEDIGRGLGVSPAQIHVGRDLAAPLVGGAGRKEPSFPGEGLRVCFLSRIVRMKNLDFALKVLAGVRVRICFRVFGPQEDAEYWKECENLRAALPGNIRMTYEGAVPADRVGEVLAGNDILFLPTQGENFGHVLLEAWASGIPVLASDRTPWRELASAGVGWDLPLEDPGAFVRALEEFATLDATRRASFAARCRAFALSRINDDAAIEDNRRMFLALVARKRAEGA